MATLFVLSHAPASDPVESHRLSFAREGDAAILIEDAVYAAAPGGAAPSVVEEAQSRGMDVFALEPDLLARGIETDLKTVDYAGFAELLAAYDRAVH